MTTQTPGALLNIHRQTLPIALATASLLLVPITAAAQDAEEAAAETPSILFVANSTSASFDGSTLTLDAVPSVIWFTDRPDRLAGHIDAAELVEAWDSGADSFAVDPPNAVISVLDGDGIDDAVIVLESIEEIDGGLVFAVSSIEGDLPSGDLGPSSLFIDSLWSDVGDWFKNRSECLAEARDPGLTTIILGCGK